MTSAVDQHGETPAQAVASAGTILLVDDNETVRRFLTRALDALGYAVLEAQGGEEALKLAATTAVPIDLLVTDLTMPGLSGQELAGRLDHLPVLFMSGHPQDFEADSQSVAFMQKPFSLGELAQVLETLLAGVRQAA